MPQIMTEEQAKTKTCPFQSGAERIACEASACAGWGWVDPPEGEVDFDNPEIVTTPIGATVKGPDWEKRHTSVEDGKNVQVWRRYHVIGPRRGQCQAMSPIVEVEMP